MTMTNDELLARLTKARRKNESVRSFARRLDVPCTTLHKWLDEGPVLRRATADYLKRRLIALARAAA